MDLTTLTKGADKQRGQDHARYDKATRKARSKIPLSVVSGLCSQTCCERRVQCLPPSQPGRCLRDFPRLQASQASL